jgi:hypothetical protein
MSCARQITAEAMTHRQTMPQPFTYTIMPVGIAHTWTRQGCSPKRLRLAVSHPNAVPVEKAGWTTMILIKWRSVLVDGPKSL